MKVLFLVDVPNLFYSARDLYGFKSRIDFMKLRRLVMKKCRGYSEIYSIAYFNHLGENLESFKGMLKYIGYETNVVQIKKKDGKLSDTDTDQATFNDLNNFAVDYDVIVIASGDGDFLPFCKYLKKKGKQVGVFAFHDSFNRDLLIATDFYEILDNKVLLRRKR